MKSASDVIVIGAGIIGCAIAYRLAQAGMRVTVIEKGRPGEEASRAAAGMLAPYAEEAHGLNSPLAELCYASLAIYPDFVTELEDNTGIKIGYQTKGSIYVATDYKEAQILAGLLERHHRANKQAKELSAKQIQEMEPALAQNIQVGVHLPYDHYVNNRELMTALVTAAIGQKVEFLTGTPVMGYEFSQERVEGVRVPGQVVKGKIVVNAAGCWAGLLDDSNRISLPVRPIRGQMVCLKRQPQLLHHLIHSTAGYLVPWPDGRILVGSTVENVGYQKDVSAQGIHQLLEGALKIVPDLASAPIREVWAGLRPDTQDNLPILGRCHYSNLIIASGHFRNGILLAPITAKLITELIVNGQPSMSLAPFSPDRFVETIN
ncbi:MAG: glycine oxidase ThiO [bacterium]